MLKEGSKVLRDSLADHYLFFKQKSINEWTNTGKINNQENQKIPRRRERMNDFKTIFTDEVLSIAWNSCQTNL